MARVHVAGGAAVLAQHADGRVKVGSAAWATADAAVLMMPWRQARVYMNLECLAGVERGSVA